MSGKGILVVVAILAAVVLLSVLDLKCKGGVPASNPDAARIKSEIAEGKTQYRYLKIEELAALARDMRVLARRYVEQGDKKKAQRAIGAAQEFDKKIEELRRANGEQP